jgi:hypothetical protein
MTRINRRTFVAVAIALLMGSVAEAQDVMALRFYLVPKIFDSTGPIPAFRAKYLAELGVAYNAMNYGREDTMLVGVQVTTTQATTLAANLDVTAIPLDLDSNVSSGALVTVQNALEALKIPGDWVNTATTYRQVIGTVGRIFQFMQRFDGLNQRTFFQSGITLDTRANQLTTAQRNTLQDAAIALGLDTSFVQSTTTVRTMLKTWVQAMGPFTLMGQTF